MPPAESSSTNQGVRAPAGQQPRRYGMPRWLWLTGLALRGLVTRPFYRADAIRQMDEMGVRSLWIVVLTGFFTGMVLALQSAVQMKRFGATVYIGNLVSASMIRELGPVLAVLMVAGRVGSGIAAELGAMRVTQQIDAL